MSQTPPRGAKARNLPGWDDLILVGKISRTQGHKGALRLHPEFEPLSAFDGLKTNELILRMPGPGGDSAGHVRLVHVSDYSFHQQSVILVLEEVEDMTAAETLRGALVYVRPNDLWELAPDEFFTYEVVGFNVVDQSSGETLGSVLGVEPGAGHDFLAVSSSANGRRFLIPLVKAMVLKIDKSARRVEVTLPDGLMEL